MSEHSPKWNNPCDVMKKINVKKRTLIRRKTIHDCTNIFPELNSPSIEKSAKHKRKNPFSYNSFSKRPSITEESTQDIQHTHDPRNLFNALDASDEQLLVSEIHGNKTTLVHQRTTETRCSQVKSPQDKTNKENVYFNHVEEVRNNSTQHCGHRAEVERRNSPKYESSLPLDWSLKVKMRIMSEASLAWCTQLKIGEESRAVTQHLQGSQQWGDVEDKCSTFHSCCLHWVYPNLPWVKLFPRIIAEQKISKVNIVASNEDAINALYRDWTESFTSVYRLLRADRCLYFYVCTHQFTVLFRGAGVGSRTPINACLTPTTRGLREALKLEGIEFRMPNLEDRKAEISPDDAEKSTVGSKEVPELDAEQTAANHNPGENTPVDSMTTCDKNDVCNEEDDEFIDNHEGASVWLESLGLDKKSFPSLDPNKVKLQRDGFRRVDNRPESLVYIEGLDVQALYNFLLNCHSCTAVSGPQAGIPPTLLAPVAFKGSTLQPNKITHSVAKQTDSSGDIKKRHVIDMSGPILPHQVINIAHLLRDSQKEGFSVNFNTHEPTSSLNTASTGCAKEVSCKQVDSFGLHPQTRTALSSSRCLQKNRVHKEILCSPEGFQFS